MKISQLEKIYLKKLSDKPLKVQKEPLKLTSPQKWHFWTPPPLSPYPPLPPNLFFTIFS